MGGVTAGDLFGGVSIVAGVVMFLGIAIFFVAQRLASGLLLASTILFVGLFVIALKNCETLVDASPNRKFYAVFVSVFGHTGAPGYLMLCDAQGRKLGSRFSYFWSSSETSWVESSYLFSDDGQGWKSLDLPAGYSALDGRYSDNTNHKKEFRGASFSCFLNSDQLKKHLGPPADLPNVALPSPRFQVLIDDLTLLTTRIMELEDGQYSKSLYSKNIPKIDLLSLKRALRKALKRQRTITEGYSRECPLSERSQVAFHLSQIDGWLDHVERLESSSE